MVLVKRKPALPKMSVQLSKKMKPNDGHSISSCDIKTPIGLIRIHACEKGLHSVLTGPGSKRGNDGEVEELDIEKSQLPSKEANAAVFAWMKEFFGVTKNSDSTFIKEPSKYPPICWDGLGKTEFETTVLKTALEKIKFGQTYAYSQLAEMVNNPRASRAVGTALKSNPIHIIVPCHRIVRADGSFGKYAGGVNIKEWLINHEKNN